MHPFESYLRAHRALILRFGGPASQILQSAESRWFETPSQDSTFPLVVAMKEKLIGLE